MAITVRAISGDAELERCAEWMSSSEPWITLQRGYDDSMAVLRDPTREVYVAMRGTDVAGFVVLCVTGAFVGYIQSIAVDPHFRGEGIGTALMRFAEERIFRVSTNVFICVSSFNPRVRALYERLGYVYVGELTDYIVRGHSELLYRKSLGPLTT